MADVPIHLIDSSTEPVSILGGPLAQGYAQCIAGNYEMGRRIIAAFLASVYVIRGREVSTDRYVREIYAERGLTKPARRSDVESSILTEAAERRFDALHAPLVSDILENGYDPTRGPTITMTTRDGRYLVGDGKNRCSILAALGWKSVPNVEVHA